MFFAYVVVDEFLRALEADDDDEDKEQVFVDDLRFFLGDDDEDEDFCGVVVVVVPVVSELSSRTSGFVVKETSLRFVFFFSFSSLSFSGLRLDGAFEESDAPVTSVPFATPPFPPPPPSSSEEGSRVKEPSVVSPSSTKDMATNLKPHTKNSDMSNTHRVSNQSYRRHLKNLTKIKHFLYPTPIDKLRRCTDKLPARNFDKRQRTKDSG